jgi:hypothetical protein
LHFTPQIVLSFAHFCSDTFAIWAGMRASTHIPSTRIVYRFLYAARSLMRA